MDQFSGSGTTLIEAKLLGRNAIGVDVNPNAGIFNLQADVDLDNFMLWEGLTMASFVLHPVEILTAILVYRKRRKK